MGRGSIYGPADKRKFFAALVAGESQAAACRLVGISYKTGSNWRKHEPVNGQEWRLAREEQNLPDVLAEHELCDEAKRGLEDFEFFRAYYLGHVSMPWQIEAAVTLVELLASPDKEYVVLNVPPGAGKSTLFTHDIVLWAIVRNRAVRIIVGSRTQRQAERYSLRVRRSLERTRPFLPPEELVSKGLALNAQSTLARDYGRFKPSVADLWRVEEFVVAQTNDALLEDKEPTVAAYGMDSGFLGNRGDMVLWDDLVDRKVLKTIDSIENQRSWWDEEAETRLEPGGLLGVVGQRMGAEDLYRYCLDMHAAPDEDTLDDLSDEERQALPRKYRHIVYRAHDETKCEMVHRPSVAKPWPEGCLLDPRRLPWRELAAKSKNREEVYRVQYQQEDVDPALVTVPRVYIDGGTDPESGAMLPGCWDPQRSLNEIPQGLVPPLFRIATADPSPTRFWAIEEWLWHPASNQRFLIDLCRQVMDAPDFLDWNENAKTFSGVMEEWQVRSIADGLPISHWIVESNAAQRFMLQYDHVHRWMRQHQVQIVPHQTHVNKINDTYGVTMLKNVYKHGLCRLPGKENSRNIVMKLVDEASRHPNGSYDDCFMAQWFFEYQLPRLGLEDDDVTDEPQWRPSWLKKKVAA